MPLFLVQVLGETLTFAPVTSDVAGQRQKRGKTQGLKNIPDNSFRGDPGGNLMMLKGTKPTGWRKKN